MTRPDPPSGSPLQWLASLSIGLLVAAIALTVAVDLLRDIWPWLLGTGLLALGFWLAVAIGRWRARHW